MACAEKIESNKTKAREPAPILHYEEVKMEQIKEFLQNVWDELDAIYEGLEQGRPSLNELREHTEAALAYLEYVQVALDNKEVKK